MLTRCWFLACMVRIAVPTTCVRAVCSSCDADKMCDVCSAVFSALVEVFVPQFSLRSWRCLFCSCLCLVMLFVLQLSLRRSVCAVCSRSSLCGRCVDTPTCLFLQLSLLGGAESVPRSRDPDALGRLPFRGLHRLAGSDVFGRCLARWLL